MAALQNAATARQEVSELQEARRRLEWQSQLLEKMSKVGLCFTLPAAIKAAIALKLFLLRLQL
jgi:hypothetical protein